MEIKNEKNIKSLFTLIILSCVVALSFRFAIAKIPNGKVIDIRFEDIFLAIFCIFSFIFFILSKNKKIEKPQLFLPIILWFSFGFLTTFFNCLSGNVNISIWQDFFYLLKETEYLVFYFYFYYHIKNIESAKLLMRLWVLLAGANAIFVFFQLVSRSYYGEYGTAAISEYGVFPTGAFFLLLFTAIFNYLIYNFEDIKNYLLEIVVLELVLAGCSMGAFGSAAKAVFLGVMVSIIMTLFFFYIFRRRTKVFSVIALTLLFIFIGFFFTVQRLHYMDRVVGTVVRWEFLESFDKGRLEPIIKPMFKSFLEQPAVYLVFGMGKGYVGEAHNQYLRNFIETGIIGSILFLFLIFIIMKKCFVILHKNYSNFLNGLSAGVLVSTIVMLFFSIATEPFIVVKPSEVYWIFLAITMAVLNLENKEIEKLKVKNG